MVKKNCLPLYYSHFQHPCWVSLAKSDATCSWCSSVGRHQKRGRSLCGPWKSSIGFPFRKWSTVATGFLCESGGYFFYSLCIFGVPAVKDVVWDLLIFILVLRVKHLPFSAGWVALGTTWNRGFECKCLWLWRLLWCLVGLRPIEEIQLPSLY